MGSGRLANPRRMLQMETIQREIYEKLDRSAQLAFYLYFVEQIGQS
jgi:hypothetical protein